MVDTKQTFVASALCASLASASAWAQDDGQMAFNNSCRTCHTVKEGDNRQGPSLAGVVGRKAGSLADFNYSDSMKQSGIIWDEANLDRFIVDPEQVVRGNTMKPYGGITDAARRKQIIDFLKSGG